MRPNLTHPSARPVGCLGLLLSVLVWGPHQPTNLLVAADSGDYPIRFDLSPVVAGREPSAEESGDGDRGTARSEDAPARISVELKISAMLADPATRRIDQWLVRCVPRDRSLLVADYAPRTETSGDALGPLSVRRLEETNDAVGISVDGSYGHALRGKVGADRGQRSSESVEFQRLAAQRTVVASGTIARGRGVYFKLRSTPQQILEGEKRFEITFAAGPEWRSALLDVTVVAEAERRKLAGLDREIATLGAAHFVVAVYRQGDHEARLHADRLIAAEDQLRELARRVTTRNGVGGASSMSLTSLMHAVATKFDPRPSPGAGECVEGLLRGEIDPRQDRRFRHFPPSFRTQAIAYVEARESFRSLAGEPAGPPDASTENHVARGRSAACDVPPRPEPPR